MASWRYELGLSPHGALRNGDDISDIGAARNENCSYGGIASSRPELNVMNWKHICVSPSFSQMLVFMGNRIPSNGL